MRHQSSGGVTESPELAPRVKPAAPRTSPTGVPDLLYTIPARLARLPAKKPLTVPLPQPSELKLEPEIEAVSLIDTLTTEPPACVNRVLTVASTVPLLKFALSDPLRACEFFETPVS